MGKIRIALAQINTTVGDFEGNKNKIIDYINLARSKGANIVLFPELSVPGYPPEDLLLRPDFIEKNAKVLDEITSQSMDICSVVGFIEKEGNDIYNASAFIWDGRLYGTYRKMFLPNYGVFDEKRYFTSGRDISIYDLGVIKVGINICEDIWHPEGPASVQAVAGASAILSLNASPYQRGKWKIRERMISTRASDNASYVLYVNAVGGQDELIFEGGSVVFAPDGELIARGKFFEEDLILVDIDPEFPFRIRLHDLRIRERMLFYVENSQVLVRKIPFMGSVSSEISHIISPSLGSEEEVYKALVLGVRDYVLKNGFKKVVVGISGGIDSALVVTIATDALGSENVVGIFMPTRYTSLASYEDAHALAENLGITLIEVPIDELFQNYMDLLKPIFKDLPPDNTEQNIQARIRGNILMAYSNKFNHLVLTTGNKSEMAVGYATLYGDMAGGFGVIKDIPKTLVYRIAKYRNSIEAVIPERILTKAPSAELKEGQKDEDNLPPYHILDPILKALIEEDRAVEDVIADGFDPNVVRYVAKMVLKSEYKRRQAPPGIKITHRAFGRDRRIPITNKFFF